MENEKLEHHGIKGMRWGIRRTEDQLRRVRGELGDDYESKKQDVLKRGSAKDILKFKGDLTNKELQDAVNRLNLESQLQGQVKTGFDKFTGAMNKVGQVTDGVNKGIGAWNVVAKVVNTFAGNKMPVIDGTPFESASAVAARLAKEDLINSGTATQVKNFINNGGKLSAKDWEAMNKRMTQQDLFNKRYEQEKTKHAENDTAEEEKITKNGVPSGKSSADDSDTSSKSTSSKTSFSKDDPEYTVDTDTSSRESGSSKKKTANKNLSNIFLDDSQWSDESSASNAGRAKALVALGYTHAEIANKLDVAPSTVSDYLDNNKEKKKLRDK